MFQRFFGGDKGDKGDKSGIDKSIQKTKQTWFSKVVDLFNRTTIDEDLWDELEELLIGADVGVGTTTRLMERMRERVRSERAKDPDGVRTALQEELLAILPEVQEPVLGNAPAIIFVVGVNGSGKTTSIGKLTNRLKQEGNKVLLAAADTFRAAAIEQLKIWGDRNGVDVVSHQTGADPGAVVFDAIQAFSGRKSDYLIVDTAGRLQTKFNLMEELKKIRRVVDKVGFTGHQEVLLVIDATTGQNGLSQAKHFTEAVGITGIVLAKLDGTAKGGVVFGIADEFHIPIKYIGTGEGIDDFAEFNPREFVQALFT